MDALSDDGRHGFTIIAFIGSVFSPFYAWSRRNGAAADPERHCCLNVALYGRPKRWAMTERGSAALQRSETRLAIGPSALDWDGACLRIDISEVTAPLPSSLRGTIRVFPRARTRRTFVLDEAGRHRWSPIAPACRVEVELQKPGLRWSGAGYLDSNEGDRELEADFTEWDWCRAPTADGAMILYDAQWRAGTGRSLALRIGEDGSVSEFAPPPRAALPSTLWHMHPLTRCDAGSHPLRLQTLEDAPFYTRAVIETRLGGERLHAVHESLSLDRFRAPWVQAMLPFRIPRRW